MYIFLQCGTPASSSDGVTVTIEGTTFSTTTDNSGAWRVDQLPAGTYVVSFSKPGFGIYKAFGYQFTGGGTAYFSQVPLWEIPTGFTSAISVDSTAGPGISIQYDVAWPCDNCFSSLIVLGKDRVSLSPANYSFANMWNQCGGAPLNHVEATFQSSDLAYSGVAPGSKVYVKTYAAFGSGYYDPSIGRRIYTAVSNAAASLDSIVVP